VYLWCGSETHACYRLIYLCPGMRSSYQILKNLNRTYPYLCCDTNELIYGRAPIFIGWCERKNLDEKSDLKSIFNRLMYFYLILENLKSIFNRLMYFYLIFENLKSIFNRLMYFNLIFENLKSHLLNFYLYRCIKVNVGVPVMWFRDSCLLYTYLLMSWDVWLLSDIKEFKSNLPVPVLRWKWTDLWEDTYIYRVMRKKNSWWKIRFKSIFNQIIDLKWM
jgi:hypothetical protein